MASEGGGERGRKGWWSGVRERLRKRGGEGCVSGKNFYCFRDTTGATHKKGGSAEGRMRVPFHP